MSRFEKIRRIWRWDATSGGSWFEECGGTESCHLLSAVAARHQLRCCFEALRCAAECCRYVAGLKVRFDRTPDKIGKLMIIKRSTRARYDCHATSKDLNSSVPTLNTSTSSSIKYNYVHTSLCSNNAQYKGPSLASRSVEKEIGSQRTMTDTFPFPDPSPKLHNRIYTFLLELETALGEWRSQLKEQTTRDGPSLVFFTSF